MSNTQKQHIEDAEFEEVPAKKAVKKKTKKKTAKKKVASKTGLAVAEAKSAALQVQPTQSQQMLTLIGDAASNPDVDVDKMERLWEMKKEIDAKEAEDKFNKAMVRAQASMGNIAPDGENKHTRSKYAKFPTLNKILKPIYTSNGFSLSFNSLPSGNTDILLVACYVSHVDGHTRTYELPMPVSSKGAKGGDVMTPTHATGSGMSYAKRYLLLMIFNIAIGDDTDDDGNAAGGMKSLPRISEHQQLTIHAMIEENGLNEARILNTLRTENCSGIADIREQAYDDVIGRLNHMIKAKNDKEAQA